jgi:hypothetical protein
MAANNVVLVSNTDFDEIKSSLKGFLSSRPELLDYNFESSVINLLLDVLSYNTYHNTFYLNMVANEAFLDSAQLRNSVVSRGKMLGYTPRSAQGASASLMLTMQPTDQPQQIIIPKNVVFTSIIDNITYKFVTPQSYKIEPTDAGVYTKEIEIYEGDVLTHRYVVNTNNPLRYVIPNSNIDTRSLSVKVQTSDGDSTTETYVLATDITQLDGNSRVFFLEEGIDEKYEISFGDGVIGKQLLDNNIVILEYRVCNGAVTNGAANFVGPSGIAGYDNFTFTVLSNAAGGSERENIDSIKFNAPKNFETQGRVVNAKDFERVIKNEFGYVKSVSAWGGEENIPPIYGKVYISVNPFSGAVLSRYQKNDIALYLEKFSVMAMDTEFVDPSYIYVVPDINVSYDSASTTLSASNIQDLVSTAIINYEINNLGTFEKKKFKFSEFMGVIDDAHPSIDSNLTTIKMKKRFIPNLSTNTTYKVNFNNPIKRPVSAGHTSHAGSHFISSTSFVVNNKTCYFDDDGEGVLRIYYISTGNVVTYLDSNAGTINYETGLITITSLLPTSYAGSGLEIYAIPTTNNITSIRNQIILISNVSLTITDIQTDSVVASTTSVTTTGVNSPIDETATDIIII